MSEDVERVARENIESLRRERDQLAEQIRRSQETITRSQELLKRMDEMLAKAARIPRK
jgi:hypothetical protein